MTLEQRKTPGEATRGIPENHHSNHHDDTSSIADSIDHAAYFGQLLEGIYIVVAEIRSAHGDRRFRRRFYANLPSAQKAIDRSRMNGKEAYLFIGHVTIVGGDHHE